MTFQPLTAATRLQRLRLDLPRLRWYYRPHLAIRPVGGRFDADVRLQYDAQGLRLQQAGATLDGLQLPPPQEASARSRLCSACSSTAANSILAQPAAACWKPVISATGAAGYQVRLLQPAGQIGLLQWRHPGPAAAPPPQKRSGVARWQVNELHGCATAGLDWFGEAPIRETPHLALAGLRLQVLQLAARPAGDGRGWPAASTSAASCRLSGSLQPTAATGPG